LRSASARRCAGVPSLDRARRWTTTSESEFDAKIEPSLLELHAELTGIHEVAVVGERDEAAARSVP
jgi:hypothetical protein